MGGQSRDEGEERDAGGRTEGTSQTRVNIEALPWTRTGRDWSTCTHPSTTVLIALTSLLDVLISFHAVQPSTLSTCRYINVLPSHF